jgi:hypothetical protein
VKPRCPECDVVTRWAWDGARSYSKHCPGCLAEITRQVTFHADVWASLLLASLAMTGRWPEIDSALLLSDEAA